MFIDEAFEIQIEFERIYIGDANTIGHDAIGSATSPYVEDIAATRIFYNIPGDEEIRGETQLVDQGEFFFDSFPGNAIAPTVPSFAAFHGEFV